MGKTNVNNYRTALAIFFVATAVVLIGGLAVIPTADAKVNCRTQPDGDIACAGGEGDTGTTDGPGGNVNRGHGGHSVTDADAGETTSQGGGGAHVSDEGENFGGGEGGRCTSEGCVGGGPGLPTD